jgi:hypothetical protein
MKTHQSDGYGIVRCRQRKLGGQSRPDTNGVDEDGDAIEGEGRRQQHRPLIIVRWHRVAVHDCPPSDMKLSTSSVADLNRRLRDLNEGEEAEIFSHRRHASGSSML